MERQAISKRVRFEVLKRDSFKCQYCGATAPDVLLHIDHIKAVAEGGTDDITNLIAACQSCNLGKGAVPLSDDSAIQKSRRQMEELQERREQLEMLMEWREGLRDLNDETINRLAEYWHQIAPGFTLNEIGKARLRKWFLRYSVEELTSAMDVASVQYLKHKSDGTCEDKSWEDAFWKIPAICRVSRASEREPDLKELYYIRGILRNRIRYYFDDRLAIRYLRNARSWDIPVEELREIAFRVKNWSQFTQAIGEVISERRNEYEDSGDPASAEATGQ